MHDFVYDMLCFGLDIYTTVLVFTFLGYLMYIQPSTIHNIHLINKPSSPKTPSHPLQTTAP